MKLPRADRGSEDFSTMVKERQQSHTRTGQACDRCKVRCKPLSTCNYPSLITRLAIGPQDSLRRSPRRLLPMRK